MIEIRENRKVFFDFASCLYKSKLIKINELFVLKNIEFCYMLENFHRGFGVLG